MGGALTSFVLLPATFCSFSCCEDKKRGPFETCHRVSGLIPIFVYFFFSNNKTNYGLLVLSLGKRWLNTHQVSELSRQAAVGLLHVHHFGVGAQDVELAEPGC